MGNLSLAIKKPPVVGDWKTLQPLAPQTWFRVGGAAEVLFRPKNVEDLQTMLTALDKDVPVTTLGVASNVLVRDGGIRGVVVRLGSAFGRVTVEKEHVLRCGAAALDTSVARHAMDHSIAGLEFFRGIPGTIGGALRMNAGAYGREVKDVLIEAKAIDRQGQLVVLTAEEMGFAYRHSSAPTDLIFIEATFQGTPGNRDEIRERMNEITDARTLSQPIKSRTGGSTFKNPDPIVSNGRRAWELIDAAGCRGLKNGHAQVSEQHCNFLINLGDATADELETLGETVRSAVAKNSGVQLEWEIKRIGNKEPAS